MDYSVERQTALNAVQRASRLCMVVQQNLVSEESVSKKDRSPVTVADFGAQAVVNHTLLEPYPKDLIVGEEDASFLRSDEGAELSKKVLHNIQEIFPGMSMKQALSAIDRGNHQGGPDGRYWVLDPIDGTKGFLRGEQYAVALALVEHGEIVLGVLGCPNLPTDLDNPQSPRGCMLVAVKGQGAFLVNLLTFEETPIKVSTCKDPSKARFCESVEKAHSSHDTNAAIASTLGITRDPYRMDSQCKYAAVAGGLAEIYLRLPVKKDYREKIWDHAAGCIVLEEAGGKITDILGQPLDFTRGTTLADNFGIIASNGTFHGDIVASVSQHFQP